LIGNYGTLADAFDTVVLKNGRNPLVDVLVIGAGQAGLAAARALQQTKLTSRVYERHERVGDAWRRRFDSLVLFSPRRYSHLPERPMPGDPDGYPTKDEMGGYLESYARSFNLPVATGEGIVRLSLTDGRFTARTSRGNLLEASAAIVAAGAFQHPRIPAFARRLAGRVVQLDASTYRHPGQLPSGRVAVVGAGGSGRQIALEVSATRPVWLSTGRSWQNSRASALVYGVGAEAGSLVKQANTYVQARR
jgi:putative flavoprotein involved in K+ transport